MASIADVFVTVLPETSKVANGIEKALRDVDVRAIARKWGREIEQELSRDVEVKVDADTKTAEKKLDKLDKDKTVTVDVDADTSKAEAEIDAIARPRAHALDAALGVLGAVNVQRALRRHGRRRGDPLGQRVPARR
jgi:hypothetical protein